jgi:DNA-binding NarL/FixJ family response regulator
MTATCADASISEVTRRSRPLRILLVDDHALMRQGLTGLLNDELDLHVVGEAANGKIAIEMALDLQPDVILMDVTMPCMNGVDATRAISCELPGIRIIGLSMHESELVAAAMLEAGAVAYVPKHASTDVLLAAIRAQA